SLATAANSGKAPKPDTKTVKFDGYAVSGPASWPVYDLTKNPRRCVRFDIHAVYLGTPGPDQDQDCPANLIGRVDTISIGSVPKTPGVRKTSGDRKGPARTGQRAPAPGTIVEVPDLHELALAMPDA